MHLDKFVCQFFFACLKEARYFLEAMNSHAKTALQVQNLIERCLQLYMNQKEVIETLSFQAKIEPSFTELGNALVHT